MAEVTRTFRVLEQPAKTWRAVCDVNRWVLALPDAAEKGWGDRWSAQAPGPGAAVSMLEGSRVVQEWQVEEWTPGRSLKLASRVWRGAPQRSMASSLTASVAPASATETMVTLTLSTRFDGSLAWFLNLVVPLKADLARVLSRMERGIVDALSA